MTQTKILHNVSPKEIEKCFRKLKNKVRIEREEILKYKDQLERTKAG